MHRLAALMAAVAAAGTLAAGLPAARSQAAPAATVIAASHRQLADCAKPRAGMSIVRNAHGVYVMQVHGRIVCQRHPREIHNQINLQKEVADNLHHMSWHYVGFGPNRAGIDGSMGRTLEKNFACHTNIYRVAWFVYGVSSSGVPYSGQMFCTADLLVHTDYCRQATHRDPRPTGSNRVMHRCTPLPHPNAVPGSPARVT